MAAKGSTKYAALLRGIMPSNPNARNEKLRGVFQSLGFANVQTVISSGNVLFETHSKDAPALETTIEKALSAQLGIRGAAIIRSREQLQKFVEADPFRGFEDSVKFRRNVTFLKTAPRLKLKFPCAGYNQSCQLVAMHDRAICSVIDVTGAGTPELMSWLEKQFGKEITTRTWQTVEKILTRLNVSGGG